MLTDFDHAAPIGTLIPLAFTLAYAAPELLAASDRSQDMVAAHPAVDCWAMGVVAFELLTGQQVLPVEGAAECRTVRQVLLAGNLQYTLVAHACMHMHMHIRRGGPRASHRIQEHTAQTTPAESTPLPISLVLRHHMHVKLTPSSEGHGSDSARPAGFRTQLHVTTSLSTGGGPVSYVLLSEGGSQVVYPLGLWSRFSGVVKVRFGYG